MMRIKGAVLIAAVLMLVFVRVEPHGVTASNTVEICENGLDDDGDGLIDLNDPDCRCHSSGDTIFFDASLIPNPSFEQQSCCPTTINRLYCATGWSQASDATTDYFHTCGYMGDLFRPTPPQPLPDGNGFIGIRYEDNYKEYAGACLTSPMKDGKIYRLQFYVGFGKPGQVWGADVPIDLSVFGSSKCSNLPFMPLQSSFYGCPLGIADWTELARVEVSGKDEWVKVTIDIQPGFDVNAIAIGPSCINRYPGKDNYYYIDALNLALKDAFELNIRMQGDHCGENNTLRVKRVPKAQYQWYRNGVAIPNATSNTYRIADHQDGLYQVRLQIGNTCLVSDTFPYRYLITNIERDTQLCQGDTLHWRGVTITQKGVYKKSYLNRFGCDSSYILYVDQLPAQLRTIDTALCAGEYVTFGGKNFDRSGLYEITLTSQNGCDSTIRLHLTVHPASVIEIDTQICRGDALIFFGKTIDTAGQYVHRMQSRYGCDSTIVWRVSVLERPQRSIDTAICQGDQLQLAGQRFTSPGQYDISLQAANGCDSIVTVHLDVWPSYSQSYDTTICHGAQFTYDGWTTDSSAVMRFEYNTRHGCDSIIVWNVRVLPPVEVDFVEEQPISCYDQSDGILRIQAHGGAGSYQYKWNTGASTDRITRLGAGTYKLTITDAQGCAYAFEYQMPQPDPLQVAYTALNPTCDAPEGGEIQIQSITGGTAPYRVQINDKTLDIAQLRDMQFRAGRYILEVEDVRGCRWEDSIEFTTPGSGSVLLLADETEVRRGQEVTIRAKMTNLDDAIAQIRWYRPDGVFGIDDTVVRVYPDQAEYPVRIEVVDVHDCVYTYEIVLRTYGKFFVPNAFTPNGDGVHDRFVIYSDDSRSVVRDLSIYSRYGERVYHIRDVPLDELQDRGWDGTHRGQLCDPAVFVYQLRIEDGLGKEHFLQGTVTLIR